VGVATDDATARADALLAEGNALEDAGDAAGALARYEAARAASADHPRVPLNVANALRALDRVHDAVRTLEDAIAARPDHARAHFNLGALHVGQSRSAAAEASFRAALRLDPTMVEAAIALAHLLEAERRPAEAESALTTALASGANADAARFQLAVLWLRQDRCDEAERLLLEVSPSSLPAGEVANARGELYLAMGRHAEAHAAFTAAMAENPAKLDVGSGLLFSLNFRSDLSPDDVFREHARIGAMIGAAAGRPYASWQVAAIGERRLRIGYVSADFSSHPVGRFMVPVLAHHDRGRFDVHCFSNGGPASDEVGRALRGYAPHWHEISGQDDADVARRIHALGIDILVDLSGHTTGHRLGVFARRPAPVQATWLGYLNTTGLAAMDYRICDAATDPAGETERLHTERLIRLPHAQWCYQPFIDVPDAVQSSRADSGNVLFGSFNQRVKITDATLDLWSAVLRALPSARIAIMDTREGWSRRALLTRLAARGVDAARVDLLEREPLRNYFARLATVDIALDTFPYNGATTTLDTLWMGTPLVALRGDRPIARGGYSLVSQLGLDDLVARSTEAYVSANVKLAHDWARRGELRAALREELRRSPLLDTHAFVRDLESAYRAMWLDWVGKPR